MYFWVPTTFAKMDWNPMWDRFGLKATEITKKPHLMDRKISGDGGLFDFSSVSYTKSSTPASPNSVKDGMKTPNFELNSFKSFSGNLVRQMEIQGAEVSAAAEPLIGLKLGKRMYFEDKVSVVPMPSTTLLKKTKSVSQNIPTPNCVVQGCNADLSMAKDYHRKHRVCDSHSKCARVIVGGLERRFCQQCSRFHSLSEFDEKKRSCRKRLSDHNARRRKPQRETIQFTSARPASPFNGERQQLNYLLDNSPLVCSGNSAESPLDTPQNHIFTITEGSYSKSGRDGDISNPEYMPGIKLPTVTSMHSNEQFLASMSSVPQVLIPGSKGPPISFQFDAAPQYCSALSLLSNDDTLDSRRQENTSLHYLVHEKSNCVASAPMRNARIPTGVPLSSPDFWPLGHQVDNPRPHSFVSDITFQETQLLYEAELFSNMMD